MVPSETWVMLADQRTQIKTIHAIKEILSFEVDADLTYEAEEEAIVWDMPGIDFILGLPDIVRSYVELIISMFCSQKKEVVSSAEEVDEAPLWSDGVIEEATEDLETPLSCTLEPVLKFMEGKYDEAKAEYF